MAEVSRMSPVRRTEIFLICSDDFMYFSLEKLAAEVDGLT